MKKNVIKAVACLAVAGALCAGFAGCTGSEEVAKISLSEAVSSENFENVRSFTSYSVSGLEGYSYSSQVADGLYSFYKYSDGVYSYCVYCPETGTKIYEGTFAPQSNSYYYFYVYNSDYGIYTYYDKNGMICQSSSSLSSSSFFVDDEGNVTLAADSSDFYGNLYCSYSLGSQYTLKVYYNTSFSYSLFTQDTDKFLSHVDISDVYTGNSATVIAGSVITADAKLLLQARTTLPEDASDYDYYVPYNSYCIKYKVNTYKYDIVSGELTELDDFGYLLNSSSILSVDKYNQVPAYKINSDKTLSSSGRYIFIDGDCNVVLDTNDYVKGCSSISSVGKYTVLNGSASTAIFDGDTLVLKYLSSTKTLCNNGLLKVGSSYYDFSGERLFTVTSDMSIIDVGTCNGLIYYTKLTEGTSGAEETHLYSYNANTSVTKDYGIYDNIVTLDNGFIIYKDSENSKVYVYSPYSGELITEYTGTYNSYIISGDVTMVKVYDSESATYNWYRIVCNYSSAR